MLLNKIFLTLKQKKSFLKSVQVYSVTDVLERFVPFLLMPVLTRLLTTYDYGIVATFNAIRTNLAPLLSASTAGAVGRAYFERDEQGFSFRSYIYNALLVNTLFMLFIIMIVVVNKNFIPTLRDFNILWVILAVVIVSANAISQIKVKLWIFQKKPRSNGLYRIMKILVNISVSLLLVFFFLGSWKGRVLGIGIAEILFCLIAMFLLFRHEKPILKINLNYLKDILKFGLPLIPHSIGWMLIWTVDKYFLNAMVGVSATGSYVVAISITSLLAVISSPFDMSAQPFIYEKLADLNDDIVKKIVVYSYLYFVLLMFVALVLWLISPLLLKILVTEKFYDAYKFILWLSLGNVAYGLYRLFSIYITYSKKTYIFGYITFISGIIAVIANYCLIKLNGAIGAAQATFLAYVTSFLLTWWMANKLYPMPWFTVFNLSAIKSLYSHLRN